MDGDNSIQQISDAKGIVHFEGILNKVVAITIITKNGDYEEIDFSIRLSKKEKTHFKAYLYPSGFYKNALALEEDSLYGVTDSVMDSHDFINNSEFTSMKFREGAADVQKWIVENVIYPENSILADEQGRVFLNFIVELDGSISHVKLFRGATMSLDREAIRLVQSMPGWKPATYKGEPVRSVAQLPIVFFLN